jgi:hypothetical protein
MKNVHRVNGFIYVYGDNDKVILSNDPELATFGVRELSEDVIQYLADNPSCEWVEVENEFVDLSDLGYYGTYSKYKIIIPKDRHKTASIGELIELENLKPKQELDCPYEFTSRCTMGRCDCKPKQETIDELNKWSLEKAQEFALSKFKIEHKKGTVTRESILEVLKVGVLTGHKFGIKYQQDKNKYSEEELTNLLQKALIHKDDGEIGALVTAQGEIRTANFNQWVDKYKKK